MAASHRPAPRTLEVLSKREITPNMLRVTLGGEGLEGFPQGSDGGYIKLRLFSDGSDKPIVRTYTIREQRADAIDVNFALHEDASGSHGPATDWAIAAWPGQKIEIGGPGPAKPLPEGSDFYLIAGDMTALPAISVNLERLPADAVGYAVIEIQSEADRQDIDVPAGFDLDFVVNPVPGSDPSILADSVRAAYPSRGSVYAWVASEFSTMRELRAFLREDCGLGRDQLYISSYWKSGLSEEDHKLVKREDADLESA